MLVCVQSELYGLHQTEPWFPAAAENGLVPKNERGHVDVWNEAHIPPGCVHINYPRIKGVCKKLGVDCADAMTGFEVKHGRSVPRFEGVVICEEFKQAVLSAWEEQERTAAERAEKRRMDKIIHNWKRLVRGTIVRDRVIKQVGAKVEETGGQQAALPAAAAATADASADALASSSYGAAAVLPQMSAAGIPHQHIFANKTFDVASGAWIGVCSCGLKQSVEEL